MKTFLTFLGHLLRSPGPTLAGLESKLFVRAWPSSVLALMLAVIFITGTLPVRAFAQESAAAPSTTPRTDATPSKSANASSPTETPSVSSPDASNTAAPRSASVLSDDTGGPENHGDSTLDASNMADPQTGAAIASIPFQLLRARSSMQPSLGVSYSSTGSHSEVGYGWRLNIPKIERHNLSGPPNYNDPAPLTPIDPNVADRFEVDGQPLVPICLVLGGKCTNGTPLQPGEQLPSWASGWHYFREQSDHGFVRYFWSGSSTWVAQTKDGGTIEFGVPRDDANDDGGIDRDSCVRGDPCPNNPLIFRWRIVRQYDAIGKANAIVYQWERFPNTDNTGYLTHIYDTAMSTVSNLPPSQIPRDKFAHHTRLSYELDVTNPAADKPLFAGASPARRRLSWRLHNVDITSADFKAQDSARRHMVRRYSLEYGDRFFTVRTLLKQVRLLGACPVREDDQFRLPDGDPCAGATTVASMQYSNDVPSATTKTSYTFAEPLGAGLVFLDINGDALPDAVAATNQPGDTQKVTLTKPSSTSGTAFDLTLDHKALGADSSTLAADFSRHWIVGDWNRDGRVNLLWFYSKNLGDPDNGLYTTYSAADLTSSWKWLGGTTLGRFSATDIPLITRVADLDGDGLTDALGFGSRLDTTDPDKPERIAWTEVELTTRNASGDITPFGRKLKGVEGFSSKMPTGYLQLTQFLTDVTGDGVPDLVRLYETNHDNLIEFQVWEGRGDGTLATLPSTFGSTIEIPGFHQDRDHWRFYLHDLNADGASDLIIYHSSAGDDGYIKVYVNRGNGFEFGWSETPGHYSESAKLDFLDLTGSGVDGILYREQAGHGTFYHSYISKQRPGLLTNISNRFGTQTSITYASTAELQEKKNWRFPVPSLAFVVTNVDIKAPGGTGPESPAQRHITYDYDSPVYDPLQRRFLGFQSTQTTIDNGTDKKPVTRTRYFVGNCADTAWNGAPCGPMVDNFWTVLRGLPVQSEQTDSAGSNYLSTSHQQYKVVKLYDGMDGRKVRTAYSQRADAWVYDTGNFTPQSETVRLKEVVTDEHDFSEHPIDLAAGHGTAMAHRLVTTERDGFGNVTSSTDYGTADGGPGIEKDVPVIRAFTPIVLPGADNSYWTWRASDAYVKDSGTGANLQHSHNEYDNFGQLRKTFADLTGTLPLLRFHEDPHADFAHTAPSDASRDGLGIQLSETSYDAFGNTTRTTGPKGTHCADYSYDEAFSQLRVSEAIYTNGCGGTALRTQRVFDRGLDTVTVSIAPNGAVSTTNYDLFGRPTEIFSPNPALGVLPMAEPAIKYTYTDAVGGPYQRVKVERRDDVGGSSRYRTSLLYMNHVGQTAAVITEADPGAGDQGSYIVSGEVVRDAVGRVVTQYEPRFFSGDVSGLFSPPAQDSNTPHRSFSYDTFGRLVSSTGLDQKPTGKVVYHALSREAFDAADLASGAPRPTTIIHDGFGRPTVARRTTEQGGASDTVQVRKTYLPTGPLKKIERSHSAGSDVYTRSMSYDSWGRLLENAEPNTTSGFGTTSMKAWRYAYNDSGELVGTSDARGCGKNAQWDGMGRLLSETYSPCLKIHAKFEDRPASMYVYDAPESGQDGSVQSFAGRLAAAYDRAQRTRYTYDARGRVTQVARQIALAEQNGIGFEGATFNGTISTEDEASLQAGYAPYWYKSVTIYDEADRVIAQTMGLENGDNANDKAMWGAELTLGGLTSHDWVTTSYTARGIANHVGGSYGDLITKKVADADGLLRSVTYGDTAATEASYSYNARRLLSRSLIRRNPPEIWSKEQEHYSKPSTSETAQTVLQDLQLDSADSYDAVGNPLKVVDARIAGEWPAGAKPIATKQFSYDDIYELRRVQYETGDDVQVSPFANEASNDDTRPIPEQKLAKRVKWQSFDFDWQGNLTKSDDDVRAFHDRSTGTMVYGTPANGPNRVVSASGENGNVQATYDAAGNLTGLKVHKPGPGDGAIDLSFSYEWDEVGRLVRAKRKAVSGVATGVEFRYTYTAGGQRVIKSVEDPRAHERVYSIEVFPTLRLNGARFRSNDYERNEDTVTPYLVSNGTAIARIVHGDPGLPTIGEKKARVYFTMTDPLGSTSVVIDKSTSELVERSSYLAFGQAETDYRPARWQHFREDYRFTGKEDDVGVGLTYFGARYYVAALGQWASADPLTVHAAGADLNPYAYVNGSPQTLVDPTGLDPCQECLIAGAMDGGWDAFVGGMSAGGPTGWGVAASNRDPFHILSGGQAAGTPFYTVKGMPITTGVGSTGGMLEIETTWQNKGSSSGETVCVPGVGCGGPTVELPYSSRTFWIWLMNPHDPRLTADALYALSKDLYRIGDGVEVAAMAVSAALTGAGLARVAYTGIQLARAGMTGAVATSIEAALTGAAEQGIAAEAEGAETALVENGEVWNAQGGIDFSKSTAFEGQVQIEYTGSRMLDYQAANRAAGLGDSLRAPNGFVWHHLDDYNPLTNTGTMQLVEQSAHMANAPHYGGVAQWVRFFGGSYAP